MDDNKIIIKNKISHNNTIILVGKKHFPLYLMKPMLMPWWKVVIY